MAGQPKTYRIRKALAERATTELGQDGTIWDYYLLWLASGQSPLALARSLTERELGGEDVHRETVRRIVMAEGEAALGGDAQAATATASRAREIGAGALADEAGEILDNVSEDRDAITKAKARADFRVWLAGVYDRPMFGKQSQTHVAIDVTHLHLLASQSHNARQVVTAQPVRQLGSGDDAQPVDYQVVSDSATG
jgi:hypothetical protein